MLVPFENMTATALSLADRLHVDDGRRDKFRSTAARYFTSASVLRAGRPGAKAEVAALLDARRLARIRALNADDYAAFGRLWGAWPIGAGSVPADGRSG